MKIFISGMITEDPDYRAKFAEVEKDLKGMGHTVMNPAVLPAGFEHQDYMDICFKMMDACEAICFIWDYKESTGALREEIKAQEANMQVMHVKKQNNEMVFKWDFRR